jgi:repressor of nif and glnA expression
MVTCRKCSKKLPEDANYCSNCGTYLGKSFIEEFEIKSEELVKKTKEIIEEGKVSKIIVENEEGKTLLEIPVTAGVVGIILAPWLAALGSIAAIATKCKIKVEKKE